MFDAASLSPVWALFDKPVIAPPVTLTLPIE
jgi:hypothetical protein